MRVKMMPVLVTLTISLVVASCSPSQNSSGTSTSIASTAPVVVSATGGPMAAAIANGKMIFQTGKDVDGVAIRAKKPPLHPYCAACHRPDGSGGMKLPGEAMSADLRHKALVTDQKAHPYTQALLERAISRGVDNDGKTLAPVMPRWRLSKRDLHDVAEYVLTQLK
jgi:mono/diheme cytochrome c family protein